MISGRCEEAKKEKEIVFLCYSKNKSMSTNTDHSGIHSGLNRNRCTKYVFLYLSSICFLYILTILFRLFGFIAPQNFKSFVFLYSNFELSVMKVVPEACHVQHT